MDGDRADGQRTRHPLTLGLGESDTVTPVFGIYLVSRRQHNASPSCQVWYRATTLSVQRGGEYEHRRLIFSMHRFASSLGSIVFPSGGQYPHPPRPLVSSSDTRRRDVMVWNLWWPAYDVLEVSFVTPTCGEAECRSTSDNRRPPLLPPPRPETIHPSIFS
jgi:hypothetical protein